ncbi:MAG: Rieske 2Fe-2S domain-containing protein [Planctomycetales bacterium]
MAEWHRVAALDELPPGTCREVVAGGRVVALFRVGDAVHAMDGVCPHAGGPLGQGTLTGCVVTCPWHGWQFDVTTGTHRLNARITHPVFPVKIEEGQVFVQV